MHFDAAAPNFYVRNVKIENTLKFAARLPVFLPMSGKGKLPEVTHSYMRHLLFLRGGWEVFIRQTHTFFPRSEKYKILSRFPQFF